ncbi:hypothetical protein C8J55DRAFT_604203 [Lentinula edodes]|uniref:Uncharacterized protein n=1 Tax=Lentinula lateritia TaxID=40482 RepID=A0A9W9DUK8_9AGAR|nr:hypothetical protein C8J55DRAFT_604203 [Lentinula edodes]
MQLTGPRSPKIHEKPSILPPHSRTLKQDLRLYPSQILPQTLIGSSDPTTAPPTPDPHAIADCQLQQPIQPTAFTPIALEQRLLTLPLQLIDNEVVVPIPPVPSTTGVGRGNADDLALWFPCRSCYLADL